MLGTPTLPSPLRGLGPSGGYPSRLRSLRSLRAPLARRLAALAAVAGPTPSRRASTASSAGPPRSPRAGATRRASSVTSPRSPWPAAPAAGIASARRGCTPCVAGAGFAAHRAPPCSRARTSADTSARASGSVLRTTACGSRRTDRHSIAVAAPLRRLRRRRFPLRSCRSIGRPDRPGRP